MATATQSLKDLVEGSYRYFDSLIGEMNDLIGESEKYLRMSLVKKFMSAKSQSELKVETAALRDCFDKLNDTLADVLDEKITNPKPLENILEKSKRQLLIVMEVLAKFKAVVATDVGSAIFLLFQTLVKFAPLVSRCQKFQKTIQQLQKDLRAVEKATNAKAAKTTLAAGVAALGVMTGPVGLIATLTISTGTVVTGEIIDAYIGNGTEVSALKGAQTTADLSYSAYDAMGKTKIKSFGPLKTVADLTLGSADLGLSVYNKHKIEKRLKDLMKEYDAIHAEMMKMARDIKKQRDYTMKKLAEARATAKKEGYVVSPKELERLRKELKSFK